MDACIIENDRYGGGSIMIWGGILFDFKTVGVQILGNLTGQRYVDKIITPIISPFIAANELILQQNNCWKYVLICSNVYC